MVRENGDLLRLPANAEFLLPTSPMRMQFGDVPADFIRVDDPVAKPLDLKVPDLFGYAVHEAPQEPDAADMSVDDILDLRAGERPPSSARIMFDARSTSLNLAR